MKPPPTAGSPLATINPNKYVQPNLRVADGLAGFRERLESLAKGAAKVNTVRVFQDGNFVFTHTEYDFGGPQDRLRYLPI
jgi:predicted SnoaL-like aldol condensation-catalyzing enzyme